MMQNKIRIVSTKKLSEKQKLTLLTADFSVFDEDFIAIQNKEFDIDKTNDYLQSSKTVNDLTNNLSSNIDKANTYVNTLVNPSKIGGARDLEEFDEFDIEEMNNDNDNDQTIGADELIFNENDEDFQEIKKKFEHSSDGHLNL